MDDYFGTLPQELESLIATSIASNSLNIDAVQSIIAALDGLKEAIQQSRGEEEATKVLILAVGGANVKASTQYKQWSNAVNKFSKSVDKVCLSLPLA